MHVMKSLSQHPNIEVLLKLALTILITSYECERSFSQLKLIKTLRRSTMTSERLGGLALLKLNRKECEKIEKSPSRMKKMVVHFNQLNEIAFYFVRLKLLFILSD